MENAKLKPFLRPDLDILFVGLNPAKGSNDNGHYFSVKQSFWNQLYNSGLILNRVDCGVADQKVFGSNSMNYKQCNYGITDLVITIAESNSTKVKPTIEDCIRLKSDIENYRPKIVIILHSKVIKKFVSFLGYTPPVANSGSMGRLMSEVDIVFYNIAFPHGNSIRDIEKEERYKEIRMILDKIKKA